MYAVGHISLAFEVPGRLRVSFVDVYGPADVHKPSIRGCHRTVFAWRRVFVGCHLPSEAWIRRSSTWASIHL